MNGIASWDVILTEDEIELLAKGIDPRLIQPEHLVEYQPPVAVVVEVD